MREVARTAAVIELLEIIDSGEAADRAISAYFRARRYAGAKDRTAISARIFEILRRKAELIWRVGEDLTPRLAVLAGRRLFDQASMDDLNLECNGTNHAPEPLLEDEQVILARLDEDHSAPPDWVQGNYPAWLDQSLRVRFGPHLLDEMQALAGRAPVDLRVNLLKATREQVLAALEAAGVEAIKTPFSPIGIRLKGRARLEGLDVFQQGWFEPQDEGSQLAALLTGTRPGECAIDLCAGAGGKTLALAAEMQGQGRLIACDVEPGRLRRLKLRASRAGITNLEIRDLIEDREVKTLEEFYGKVDRVLIDAPCSGTGTWRRQPELRWRLTPEILTQNHVKQRRLLNLGMKLLKPTGILIYVTCSLLPSENEEQIMEFVNKTPGVQLIPIKELWNKDWGNCLSVFEASLQLTPLRHGTDGFFIAALRHNL